MQNRKGLTLIELMIVMAIIGLGYSFSKPLISMFMKKGKELTSGAARGAPWQTNYPSYPDPIPQHFSTLQRWHESSPQHDALRAQLTAKFGLSGKNWVLLCGDKVKCLPAGGLAIAVLPLAEGRQQIWREVFDGFPQGKETYVGFPRGTEILVLNNDSSTYRFTKTYDSVMVGVWTLAESRKNTLVFQTLEKQGNEPPKVRFFIGQEEWATNVAWSPCQKPIGGGLLQKTGEQCLTGSIKSQANKNFALGYEFIGDGGWIIRPLLGENPVLMLSATLADVARDNATRAASNEAGLKASLQQRCRALDKSAGMACYQLARLAEKEKDTNTMRNLAQTSCDKGHGYSCDWRAQMAKRENRQFDVDYWCRKAVALNYRSSGPCTATWQAQQPRRMPSSRVPIRRN